MNGARGPAVVFRRRSGWEAADLGVFFWRKNWLPMLLFMGAPAAPLILIHIITTRLELEWISKVTILLIWWLKPLLDRFGLQVISVRFFEPHSSIRGLFKNLGKTLRAGLAGDLLWRRFSLFRSARMPIFALERVKGNNYRRRKQLLSRNGLEFGLPLTLLCGAMFTALVSGALIFLQNIFSGFTNSSGNISDFINEQNILVSVVWYITMILIEMLYVSMGFSLYINSRVETEGWDIELLFKTCVEKAGRTYPRKAANFVSVLALFFLLAARPLWAQEENAKAASVPVELRDSALEKLVPAQAPGEAAETLKQIFASPEFGTEKPYKKIQFKKSDTPARSGKKLTRRFSFPDLKEILGILLRFVLGATLIAALGAGAYFAHRNRGRLFPVRANSKRSLKKDPLPDEPRALLRKAEELHRNGNIREAWALCFRIFTALFAGHWFLTIPPEATEYETLALVRKKIKMNDTDYLSDAAYLSGEPFASDPSGLSDKTGCVKSFEGFVRRWIHFAYGGREPTAENFDEAIASCKVLLENGADT